MFHNADDLQLTSTIDLNWKKNSFLKHFLILDKPHILWIIIPIKMDDFLIIYNAEISIYSRAGFFIYLSVDFLKDGRRFSTKQIKCRYLHKIKEKSRAEINGNFYIKNLLLWEWHFHKLLCEEIIFPLPSGKKLWLLTAQSIIFSLWNVEISFLHTKVSGNVPF